MPLATRRGRRRTALAIACLLVVGAASDSHTDRLPVGVVNLRPATIERGPTTLLDLTLLDGRGVHLRYPSSLGVAELGLTLTARVRWVNAALGTGCCVATVSASRATVAEAYGAERPIESYRDMRSGALGLFAATRRRLPPGFTGTENLVFHVDGWLVEANASDAGVDGGPPAMSLADRRLWAAHLAARTAPDGYVVVRSTPTLGLTAPGTADRLTATFGLGRPYEPQRNILQIGDGDCGGRVADGAARDPTASDTGASRVTWCDPASGLHVTAIGSRPFVDGIAKGLVLTSSGPSPR